jgi:hypothetical protein
MHKRMSLHGDYDYMGDSINLINNLIIYRTDQDGSIMFKIKNNKIRIETCSP